MCSPKVVFLIGITLFSFAVVSVSADENYYDILGISKDATVKEIRKAFKKIALKMHPDKNTGDPEAHEKFVRINGIYEVLKDEETREKYDKYGEEGLKEGFRGRYESYSYYRDEFGIYDDDPEVITLDGGDFEAAINSGEAWFINFYSPRCSHCHDLAPTWRKFAEEMNGVVNIGAVNCYDNRWICQENGIYSYPSLIFFLKGQRWKQFAANISGFVHVAAVECSGRNRILCLKNRIHYFPNLILYQSGHEPIKFSSERTKKQLINFVMSHVTVHLFEMWDKNWKDEMSKGKLELPWIVSFCLSDDSDDDTDDDSDDDTDDVTDCPSDISQRKLSGLMNAVANVATVDCDDSPKLCARAAVTSSGFHYFAAGDFPEKKGERLKAIEAREVADYFMNHLMPSIKYFSIDKFKTLVNRRAMLVFMQMTSSEVDKTEPQLKKLPGLLGKEGIEVVKLKCDDWCSRELLMTSDATILFRGGGIRDFEVFHGRLKTSELSAFAVESRDSRVATLRPSDFDGRQLVDDNSPIFVDFFAPWCPPCKALLPELRKVSVLVSDVKFATMDCVAFSEFCENFGIESYPSTYLFNGSSLTPFNGHHHHQAIRTFIQDQINPPYIKLTAKTLQSLVHDRQPGLTWVVDFYANWCGPCRALLPEWRKMAKMLDGVVKIGAIDCAANDEDHAACRRQLVDAFPEIRIFPSKKSPTSKPLYIPFNGHQRHAHHLASWVLQHVSDEVTTMQKRDFDRGVVKHPEAWVIDFYASWCGPCRAFMPKFQLVAMKLKNLGVKFGKIDCQQLPSVCSVSSVRAYPTLIFFPPGDVTFKQTNRRVIDSQEPDVIIEAVKKFFAQFKPKKDEL